MFGQAFGHYDEKSGQYRLVGWGSNLDHGLVSDFLTVARGESAPNLATGPDGLKALEVALAAYRSAESHQPTGL
jgi:predicted dehydrogenase